MALGNKTEIPACSDIAWEEVFHLAEQHHVLPMIVDAAHQAYGAKVPWDRLKKYKKRAQQLAYLQITKTQRFVSLYSFLAGRGLTPLVLKGLVCRDLYPNPDFRFSADEDLMIPPDQVMVYHKTLTEYGLKADSPDDSIVSAQEISYRSEDGVLFLEVHRFAFSPDSSAYGDYNSFFEGVFERAITEMHDGVDIRTLAPTDHMFYLICHMLKHFLHGGYGIRQVCDIGLFAQKHAKQIDWPKLRKQTDSISALNFTASLLAIAEESLGIDLTGIPDVFRSSKASPEALLEDILDSGVYGSSTMSRKHSAAITLHAAESARYRASEERPRRRRVLFPPASGMTKRYPYLARYPWLLPVAWVQRIYQYLKSRDVSNTPGQALRIGHQRVSLMEQYGLLSGPSVKKVDTVQYLSALCELIEQGYEVSVPVAGGSMVPFLGDGRDRVFVRSPKAPIQKGDIVLFRRLDGSYVLHRVYRIHGNKDAVTYDIIGDAQDRLERGIQRKQILAVATRARRKGKIIDPNTFCWWFFQSIWISMIPFRRFLIRAFTAYRSLIPKKRKKPDKA